MKSSTKSTGRPSVAPSGPRPLTVATALLLREMEFVPVRVAYAGKRPTEPAWPTLRPSFDEIGRWGVCNIGVLLGTASRGLTDIDLDTPEAIALAPYYLPPTWCFGRPSKPRSHWLYLSPGTESKAFSDDSEQTILEIRGEAATGSAHQTVLPPSVHVSGESIDWDADIGDGMAEPLTIDTRELVTCVCKLGRAVLFARDGGLSLDDARAAEAAYVIPAPKPELPRSVVRAPMSPGDVRDRARKYVARMPESVSGQRGHDHCFRVAIALVRGFCLDQGDALELLRDYNDRCDPPWSERELEHKVKQAEQARVPSGYLLDGGSR